ncbi:nucleotide sugar dehydrogenase [Streptomyces sp. NPDC050788]|uniref:nucleotide sugar dehydrogenase n=1 Tax=Streptomyces sp. NPDC050788 TaxID=3155041 RepID=UPI00344A1A67
MHSAHGRRVAVLGQGYVGLPLTMRAVEAGFDVVGFDVDKARVDLLARGESHIEDIDPAAVAEAVATGRYRPTCDPGHLQGFDVAVVCVPTPLRDGAPDLTHVEQAARLLSGHLHPGCLVVLESTTYPGTTEEVFRPLLEGGGALRAGRDFRLGYSPERIDPGNPSWHLANTPKIVSGVDEDSLRAVGEFYGRLVDVVVPVPGPREAELAKLLENTFRHVNVALVNELAMYCRAAGVDVWSVLDAAGTKPFGFMRFTPGPGVGGHCLPIDPSYLSWQARRSLGSGFRFVELANDVNDRMPDYVVTRAIQSLNRRRKAVNGSSVLLLGLTYKPNSRDARKSPALAVARQLASLGAELRAVDPLIAPADVPEGITMVPCDDAQLASADLVVVLTDHDAIDWRVVERHAGRVLDTRNRLRTASADGL